ncbi:hypothetical protein, partial [Pseudoalteromonas piscicida]|uniref:hypothetical protein n=1 Tax=Pseudoalteromonas piscicida TaxID=43662 RepID=UPI00110914E4
MYLLTRLIVILSLFISLPGFGEPFSYDTKKLDVNLHDHAALFASKDNTGFPDSFKTIENWSNRLDILPSTPLFSGRDWFVIEL